jgi:hypothetical protein
MMGEFTKEIPRLFGERSLGRERRLATRFFIYCLESAIDMDRCPRDESLFKIEMEFRPMIKISGTDRGGSGLAERLARIYRKIVIGRGRREHDQMVLDAVEKWMQKPEIKVLIAEGELTGHA